MHRHQQPQNQHARQTHQNEWQQEGQQVTAKTALQQVISREARGDRRELFQATDGEKHSCHVIAAWRGADWLAALGWLKHTTGLHPQQGSPPYQTRHVPSRKTHTMPSTTMACSHSMHFQSPTTILQRFQATLFLNHGRM